LSLTAEMMVTASKLEVVNSMQDFVRENIGSLLIPVEESWQPNDLLPDLTQEDWLDQVNAFRDQARGIPDDLLVVLVGDMVTEEALPSYQTWLNGLEGIDGRGANDNPWGEWSRGWTAEENRHGDLLNRYLYLTGRVDMRAIETTIHHLINSGFDPQTGADPYLGFVYTSFQERATKLSHRNVATLAKKVGDANLHRICGLIAGDEARHEKAYKLFMEKVFEIDPAGAVLAFATMMRNKITMPAHLMTDGKDVNLFTNFSIIAQKIGVYTAKDYASIIAHLVKEWDVTNILGLSDAAAKAQDYVCSLADRYARLAERITFTGSATFSWINDRELSLEYSGKP
jgi:acyl-[acyl-carrier-protein] desaturase